MKDIEDSTLLIIAVFILMLGSALLGLFRYYVKAMRADSRLACSRLKFTIDKVRELDIVNERTFKEFELLINRKLKTVFAKRIAHRTSERGLQTDTVLEIGKQDVALQADMSRVNTLPPLLVRPALSSDVVIPIAE